MERNEAPAIARKRPETATPRYLRPPRLSSTLLMRNILARVPQKEKARFAERLKQIWLQPERRSALREAELFCEEYGTRYPEAIRCLEDGLEDSLQFYAFPQIDKKKIASTNVVERMVREIRRRSRVIGVFPTEASYVRLVTSYLIEYSDDWEKERSYIKGEKLYVAMESRGLAA